LPACFTAWTTGVSNPVRSPSFRPSPSGPFWSDAFATGGPPGITAFHRYPRSTSDLSRPQGRQYPLHAERLSRPISQGTYRPGYERFRPNKRDHHLGCWYYRGGWHQTYPALIPGAPYTPEKPPYKVQRHLGSPRHAFAHCGVFAPAAPRRAWGLVSVPISRLRLPSPVPVVGLVVRHTTNYLIGRRPILERRSFKRESIPASLAHPGLSSVSRGYPRLEGRLTTCY